MTLKRDEFAERLGWPVKAIGPRLNALGLLDVCTRCCGSCQHSYCQRFGTVCFKCGGSGKQLPKLTVKLVKTTAARVAAGDLNEYFAKQARKRDAKRMLPSMIAECRALCNVIGEAYDAAYRRAYRSGDAQGEDIDPELFKLQNRNNRLYHGTSWFDLGGQPYFMGVLSVRDYAARGEIDVLEAVRLLTQRKVELTALVEEFRGLNHTESRTA